VRYYRRKRYANKTVKKVFLRILFVIAAALVITGLSILLGNHLLRMVEAAEKEILSADPEPVTGDSSKPSGYYSTELPEDTELTVFAVGYEPAEGEDLSAGLELLKNNFDTISVNITENGELVYVSPAMLSFARMDAEDLMTETNTAAFDRITDFGSAVKTENLRMCAVMEASRSDGHLLAAADKALLPELVGFGFDEVIITGIENVTEELSLYLANLENDMISVGVVLPAEAYLNEANEKMIQRISASGVFLCVDLGSDQYESDEIRTRVRRMCTSLRNSFDSHNLRVFIDNENPQDVAAEYAVLARLNILNVQITTAVAYETLASALPETLRNDEPDVEETQEETGADLNPYVTTAPETELPETAEVPGTAETSDTGKETETSADTYYRGEDSWY